MQLPDTTYHNPFHQFCLAGINYRKSDLPIRSKFSLSTEQSACLLEQSKVLNIPGCLVLSTCNRTEVYGLTDDPVKLIGLFCAHTGTDRQDFTNHGYVYHGMVAVKHLFKVAAGLDSQIIGDYEILSQLKLSVRQSREGGCMDPLLERIINYAFQASKEIKTKTKLSSGIVSVSYAAIEIIRERFQTIEGKKILLAGTGKFGNRIAKNLKDYLPGASISFTNRTDQKAFDLSVHNKGRFVPYKDLAIAASDTDVLIVNASSESYTVQPSFFEPGKQQLVLDLSVPQSVDPLVGSIAGVTLLNVDEVSQVLNKTIRIRMAEVPQAHIIIESTMERLVDWYRNQSETSVLREVKSQLYRLNLDHFQQSIPEEKILKTISALAIQLKHKKNKGCQCLNALNNYMQISYETIC